MSILKEFKEFAVKGNVVDLAVGVIIGAAFGRIVTSLVGDVILPPIGVLIGGINFQEIKIVIKQAVIASEGVTATPAVTINLGNFFQAVFDFTIIAFVIFISIKGLNKLKKEEPMPAPPVEPSNEEKLLTEIRDLLKK